MGVVESSNQDSKYFGFRIYKIFEGGPLSESGLTELDEFIIPPDDVIYNKISFYEYIRNHLNKNLTLNIYSVTRRLFYSIEVLPRSDWGDQRNGYLGACVRYENWASAHSNLLRVIKVKENSVSDRQLKMVALDDYIISIRPENKDFITLNNDSSDPMTIFQDVLHDNIANFIEIFIYNIKKGPRSKKIFLEQKNGEVLGCDVAYGKLHELPKIDNEEKDKKIKQNNSINVNDKDVENKKNEENNFVLEETKKILKDNLNKNATKNVTINKDKEINILTEINHTTNPQEEKNNTNNQDDKQSTELKENILISKSDNINKDESSDDKNIDLTQVNKQEVSNPIKEQFENINIEKNQGKNTEEIKENKDNKEQINHCELVDCEHHSHNIHHINTNNIGNEEKLIVINSKDVKENIKNESVNKPNGESYEKQIDDIEIINE